jgi:hypothetical protein
MALKENRSIPESAVNEFLGNTNSITGFVSKAATTVVDFANPANFMSNIRSKLLPKNGLPNIKTLKRAEGLAPPGGKDWRVKLSVPQNLTDSRMLMPLLSTGGFVFPFNPSIIMAHSAHYSPNNPVHTNYTFNSFNYSTVDQIQITGDFFVQNGLEAEYWVAAVHYLRICTKMRYGEGSSDAGSPPPVVLLNGFGDFVFKNVPVVITNFNIDLQSEVDYVSTGLNKEALGDFDEGEFKSVSWAPTQSQFSVFLQPQYSRSTVSQFNMNDFVRGAYVKGDGGFI